MEPEEYLLIDEMGSYRFLRARRIALGLTQKQVAEQIGSSQSIIAAVENGKRSLSSALESKLRRALQAHPSELLQRHRQSIVDLASELGFASIKVFGSVARGEALQDSDLDFFVEFPATAEHDAFAVMELRRRLENVLSVPVDLVSIPKNPEDYGGIYTRRHEAIAI